MTLTARCAWHAEPIVADARSLRVTVRGVDAPCPHGHPVNVPASPSAQLMWAAYGAEVTA